MFPVLFQLETPWGSLRIYAYGAMLGLSLVLGWFLVPRLAKVEDGIDPRLARSCTLVAAVSALVGARVLYLLSTPIPFPSPLQWLDAGSGGLVAYGGFLGGALASLVYLRGLRKTPFLPFADATAPALALGLLLTRIGCYLAGCDFGKPLSETAPAWLRSLGTFPRWPDGSGSAAWRWHVETAGLPADAPASLPVHPTQLYEASLGLLLLGASGFLWKRRSFRGQVLLVLAIVYAVGRALIETLRADPERGGALGLSTSQIASFAILPVAILAYAFQAARKRRSP